MIVGSFLVFLLVFLGIGIASVGKSRGTAEDYLVAGKQVPAWLAGLSAVATNNSGFMFIGMIGLTYAAGLNSIWTDAAQAFVMLAGMLLLMAGGAELAGGWEAAVVKMADVSPVYMDWFPHKDALSIVLFILGWLFGGMAVLGQPHIVVRFIALDDPSRINRMRWYYYAWFTFFYGATIVVGLLSRITFPEQTAFDAELALPSMAMQVLPDIWVGLILAALFAATLSTADSLILSCSASVTRDFFVGGEAAHKLWFAKLTTASVLALAVLVALTGADSVFALVLDAWGLLGSAFAPLVIVQALGHRVSQRLSISMVLGGVVVFLTWQQLGLGGLIYSVAPGMSAGLLIYFLGRRYLS